LAPEAIPPPAPDAGSELLALWHELGLVDRVGLALVLLLLLLGLWRGLWWQVMRFLGVAGAILLARSLAPRCVSLLSERTGGFDSRLLVGVTWLALFLAGLSVAVLLVRAGRHLLEAMQLSLLDRAAGALVGAVTGLTVHMALIVLLVHLSPATWVERSFPGTYSEGLLRLLSEELPLVVEAGEGSPIEALLRWDERPAAE
jgi:membrane protein required for colicin V production